VHQCPISTYVPLDIVLSPISVDNPVHNQFLVMQT
jgi:hypothetical protein